MFLLCQKESSSKKSWNGKQVSYHEGSAQHAVSIPFAIKRTT